jgi:hypothetical protein
MFGHNKQNTVPQNIPSGLRGAKADKKSSDESKDKPVFSNPSLEAKRKRALEILGERWVMHPLNKKY